MTLTFERDLDMVMVNQSTKYMGQRSCLSNITVRTHSNTGPSDPPGPIKLSAINGFHFLRMETRYTMYRSPWYTVPEIW